MGVGKWENSKQKKKSAGGGVESQEAYIFLNLKIPIFTITVSKSNVLRSLYSMDF